MSGGGWADCYGPEDVPDPTDAQMAAHARRIRASDERRRNAPPVDTTGMSPSEAWLADVRRGQ